MKAKGTVSLQELVPQHDCLKLLILHTPYSLNIDSLNLCFNLFKLDLSRNSLQTFPCISHFPSLKFMFLHQNQLDARSLPTIFAAPSPLSKSIVWVTFWGNKQAFLARHYLCNATAAIAVDKHMKVPEDESPNLFEEWSAFSPVTDISWLLEDKPSLNKTANEEEYMSSLWKQMRELRQKHQSIFSIIKIQKIFRGWLCREKSKRGKNVTIHVSTVLKEYFQQWKSISHKSRKLRSILQQANKSHLLLTPRQCFRREIELKLISISRKVHQQTLLRKCQFTKEIKVVNALRSHWQKMKILFGSLQVEKSGCIYIQTDSRDIFKQYIKVAHSITISQGMSLRSLFQHSTDHATEMVRILQTNFKSTTYAFAKSCPQPFIPILRRSSLHSPYKAIHFSKEERWRMNELDECLNGKMRMDKGELQCVRVCGPTAGIQHMVRLIHYHNIEHRGSRINFITEYHAKKCSAAVHIQKAWRGYYLRKHNTQQNLFKTSFLQQRATLIIQKWYRRLPAFRRTIFINKAKMTLRGIGKSFYLSMQEYMRILTLNPNTHIFLQQHSHPYIHTITKKVAMYWDINSTHHLPAQMIHNKKLMFSKGILQDLVSGEKDLVSGEKEECELSHLLHLYTTVQYNSRYVRITCSSKADARSRVLGLLLMTTSYRHSLTVLDISEDETLNNDRLQGISQEGIFISLDSLDSIHNRHNRQFPFRAKMYIPLEEDKPIKHTADLTISWNQTATTITTKEVIREVPVCNQPPISFEEESLRYEEQVQSLKEITKPNKMGAIKRPIRKHRHLVFKQPSFMLDSVRHESIQIHQKIAEVIPKEVKVAENKERKQKMRKEERESQKQAQSFMHRFVNLSNFVAHQCLNQRRRRINTQHLEDNRVCAIRVKKDIQRAASLRVKTQEQDRKKIREWKHSHYQLIQKSHSLTQQQNAVKQSTAAVQRDRRSREKSTIKRLKVSFAEECFPLAARH